MQIIVDNRIRLYDAPIKLKSRIHDDLTIENPEFKKMKYLKIPGWQRIAKWIRLYNTSEDGTLVIPRGYLNRLGHIYEDRRLRLNDVEFNLNPKITLRDYQLPAVDALQLNLGGIVIGDCGCGKTIIALAAVGKIQQPTLWITHTKDLLDQSMKAAKELFDLRDSDIGIISGDTSTVGKITFATVQTLANRDLRELTKRIGCVVVDECHHCFKDAKSFRQFSGVIEQFPALYRIGVTASEHRGDGLIRTMFDVIGPKVYEITMDQLGQNLIIPSVKFINTEFQFEKAEGKETINTRQMTNAMAEDVRRNNLILSTIVENCKTGNFTLVLADNLKQLNVLNRDLSSYLVNSKCIIIHGKTPKPQREQILEDMRNGKVDFLFATYQLAKEGLNIPRLDRIFMTTPVKDEVIVQQSSGRGTRPFPGKTDCIVYDFYDINIPTCVRQARERRKTYDKKHYKVIGGPVKRKSKVEQEADLQKTLMGAFKI